MLKTTQMRLVELMILKEDIDNVLEYVGKKGDFQLENVPSLSNDDSFNPSSSVYDKLQLARNFLALKDVVEFAEGISIPKDEDYTEANNFLDSVESLQTREKEATEQRKRVSDIYDEAKAFANLNVSYKEIEHLTFLTFRIGKIDPSVFSELQFDLGNTAMVVPLGDDKTRILAASSKKGRFALDSTLSRFGFVALEVPKDFKGIPADMLNGLKEKAERAEKDFEDIREEHKNFASISEKKLDRLLQVFALGQKVREVRNSLESTQLVYRITGWIPAEDSDCMMRELDDLTEGRVAIRIYNPEEVPSVKNGREKVPVKLTHGKFVKSFERMIFSYGAPLYGTVDPTPMVAFFFTLLFGIMFGDVGQGFVFLCLGILLNFKKIKPLHNWWKFGPIFMAIGCSSMVMGLLTGEFFTNGEVLAPFSRFVTGLFGEPRDHILHLMPEKGAMGKLLMFFGFTLGVGFLINSVGLVINIVNQFSLKHPGKALFSKTGIAGTLFFWYVVVLALRLAFFSGSFEIYDAIVIGVLLLCVALSDPLTRLVEGKRPVFENGFFSAIIEGIVEILEIVSTYISNSVSFVRVGAFALSHAVLSFIIFTLTDMLGGSISVGGIAVTIIGNIVIIVLEGMIVAIQVIRLQYYEFFSKFFTETGKEFKPLKFEYKK